MEAVLIVLIVIGLPVVGGLLYAAYETYLKHQKESGGSELKKKVQELERRIEALEIIVTSADFELHRRLRKLEGEVRAVSSLEDGTKPKELPT